MMGRAFQHAGVRDVFEAFPPKVQERLFELRALIFETADELDGVGMLEETLRWGEPSYLTTASNSGTMIRLGCKDPETQRCAIYVHCQTDLIETFKAEHGDRLAYEGKRAVLVDIDGELPAEALRDCIAMALTYKIRKR